MTLATQLAEFAAPLEWDGLPTAVRDSLRERALDIVGLGLAASELETGQQAIAVARAWGGPAEARLISTDEQLPAVGAGFVNGVLAHALDFDDTHLPSVLHPSASIVPAALAAGEAAGVSIGEALAAAAAGYEVCVRTGMAAYDRELGNSVFFERGWHATSICGALAAAVVGAKIYGLGAEGIRHAIGIACSMGGGIIEANRSGGTVKKLHCGWAAHGGLVAAQCARQGITGPPTALEGRFGFYEAYCSGTMFADEITDGLGSEWCIPGVFYKPYPANHFTHAGIDAARSVRQQMERDQIELEQIERIELGVASAPLRTIGQPWEEKIQPQSGYHGSFSGPFTVAAALLGGGGLGLWLDDFVDANVNDPRYLELAAKVEVYAEPECDAIFPKQFPAVLRVHLQNGEILEEKVLENRGGPGNPLSREELQLKFRVNAGRSLAEDRAAAIAAVVFGSADRPVAEILEAQFC